MIKKLFTLFSVFLLSTGILIFPACGREEALSLKYTEGVNVQFLDPCGDYYVNTSLGYETEYKGVIYKFAKTLTEDERNSTVSEMTTCLDLLENRVGALEKDYTAYVVDDYYVPYTDGNNLYFGYENILTAEFATAVVQLVYGRDVNYGVLYGLGASIANERGYKNNLTKLKDALSLYETEPRYLDLNYACFLDSYADSETQAKVKTLSIEFYNFLKAKNKIDLLSDYSDEKRRNYFNEFLLANGKGEYNACDLDGISFYGGGNIIRLFWENENAKFRLYEDFKDGFQNGSLGKDPLNCGYTDLRQHIVNFEAQMLYTREKLAAYNDAPEKVTVKFARQDNSWYDMDNHTINLNSVTSLKHEYTHSVLNGKYGFSSGTNAAIIHCLVYYFAQYPINEQLSYEVQLEHYNINYVITNNLYPKYTDFINKLTEKLGHEINLFDLNDYKIFYDYVAKWDGDSDTVETVNSGYAQISLGNYLVAQFGEKYVYEAAFNNTPEEILGKAWGTIISEWRTYLDENCNL